MNNLSCPIIKQVSWSKNAPSICSVYLQKALQQRHGWRWFQTVAMFWLRPKLASKSVQGCTLLDSVRDRSGILFAVH